MRTTILLLTFGAAFVFACKKDKDPVKTPPPVEHEPELITSLVLVFEDSVTAETSTFAFRDPDGPGGNPPATHDTIQLTANRTYAVKLHLLDETKSPADTVSHEIEEESDEHQLFFGHSGVAITTTYLDADKNGYPVGLLTKWRTGSAGTGTSRVRLKHQPGTKDGTDGTGETDVEVVFRVVVN